jgi:peptide/nickel transport system permease protein
LSGGTRQRVMIAMASMLEPVLLVADEPTTALDVTVQAQVMRLLREINAQGTAILLISHNIVLLSDVCDRIVVMYAGRLVERLPAGALWSPRHPYTELLLAAVPDMDRPRGVPLETIPGTPADAPEDGCPFAPRCPLAEPRCWAAHPPTTTVAAGHEVACWVRGGVLSEATA